MGTSEYLYLRFPYRSGTLCSLDVKECKTRWTNLRNYYMKKKKDFQKPSGSAAEKKITQSWAPYKYLSFLDDTLDNDGEYVTFSFIKNYRVTHLSIRGFI